MWGYFGGARRQGSKVIRLSVNEGRYVLFADSREVSSDILRYEADLYQLSTSCTCATALGLILLGANR
jgi:hypothetical protein